LVALFLNGDFSRIVPVVSSFYTVLDMQRHPTGEAVRFLIAENDIYSTFPKLLQELSKSGMIATAKRARYSSRLMPTLSSTNLVVESGIVVTVSRIRKDLPRSRLSVALPALLFAATLAVVFIDGLYKAGSDFARVFIQDPFLIATVYTMSLMGILGVHEMGHMIANRWHGVRSSWPYFIPIIPGVFLVPTLGAAIVARSNMTNRNVLFDVGISGPIAGLIVTVVVAFYGSQISVLIPAFQVDDLEGQLMRLPTSFLMAAIQDLTVSDDDDAGDGSVLIMSPVLIAAWVGFFVTFLNLMPAAQLDGGHIVRSALGIRWHRTLTYSSIAFMIGLGFATQIFGITLMAIFVLLIARRAPESTPLDDVSPLSKKRKALFWVAIAITILCAPLPQEVFNPLF
jgi:hypothetical protein